MSKEIVVGVERIPIRTMAFNFTPAVLPDLFSAKLALEYKLHKHLSLVIPLEAKWMNYRWAIRLGAKIAGQDYQRLPQDWYANDLQIKSLWNIDFSQLKISTGVGLKWYPFSEAMTSAFYMKTLLMAGVERFNSFHGEGIRDSAVFTHVVTLGYTWVKARAFTFGFELGEEIKWHTNPIKHLPTIGFNGFMPILQFNLGFTI